MTRRWRRAGRITLSAVAPSAVALLLVATIVGCLATEATPSPSSVSSASPSASGSPSPSLGPRPGASPTASAAVATKPTPCPGTDRTPGLLGRQLTGNSTNWAGYVSAVKRTGVTCIEASWIEPTVTCPKTGNQSVAIWIGIDGFSAATLGIPATDVLIQIGTQVTCSNGFATHGAWHEILPGEPHEVPIAARIRAGDHLSAKISYADGKFTLILYDQEAEGKFTLIAAAPGAPRKTAEWVVEAPATDCPGTCTLLPLPKFAAIRFTNAHVTIAGTRSSINDNGWSNVRLKMVRGGVTRATPSALSSGGTSFRVTWFHS